MAQFCTKCGAPLVEGMKFCTGCGATVGAPAAPGPVAPAPAAAAPVAPVSAVAASTPAPASSASNAAQIAAGPGSAPPPVVPAARVATPVAAPKSSSGSPVLKIVLGVLAVIALLTVVSVGAGVYYYYHVVKPKMVQIENRVHATFPVPAGTREVHTEPPPPAPAAAAPVPGQDNGPVVAAGVPIYPGATAKEGGGEVSVGGLKVQQYTTDDSVDKVAAFYKDKMGPNAIFTQSGGSALVQLSGSDGVISITISSNSDNAKTAFTISSITKQ